jgi:hypothetical protein
MLDRESQHLERRGRYRSALFFARMLAPPQTVVVGIEAEVVKARHIEPEMQALQGWPEPRGC